MKYNSDVFIEHLVEKTREYVSDLRGERSEFSRWYDNEEGVFKAKFSYGRVGRGSEIEATMMAISNLLTAIKENGL